MKFAWFLLAHPVYWSTFINITFSISNLGIETQTNEGRNNAHYCMHSRTVRQLQTFSITIQITARGTNICGYVKKMLQTEHRMRIKNMWINS